MIHSRELTAVGINPKKTSKKDRIDILCDKLSDIKIIGIESFRVCCTERVPSGIKNKNKEVINYSAIQKIIKSGLNIFVIDEAHKIKDPSTIIFEVCATIASAVKYRYLLTGTFFHKLNDVWAQYYITDLGETFGKSYRSFLKKYFINKPKYIRRAGIEIPNWVVTPEGEKEILRLMYRKSIRYDESEVKGMPEKVFEDIRFELSPEQDRDYRKLLAAATDKHYKGNANFFTVYRQICSGFIISTGKIYSRNPKMDLLEGIAEEIVGRDKLVVFHEFNLEYELIGKLFKKMKIKYCAINGHMKDNGAENKKFMNDDSYRAIIVNTKSGSESIDLQVARYAVFFSSPLSVITRKQAIKRIHRGKINRTRFYYDFTARNTIEATIYRKLKSGTNVFDEAMNPERIMKALTGQL
jgi:SNF2 family DNA or RNA helicase